jgi:uncharacterized protein YbjT (DUF2867 family)
MIAVMGASGNVGSKVTNRLLEENQRVRAFGRSAERLEQFAGRGAEVVVGDALDLDALQMLFKGAVAALVVLPDNVSDTQYAMNRSKMSRAITDTLRAQHVGHVVLASSIGADRDRGVGPIAGLHEIEVLLFGLKDASVLALRAAWHMENLLLNIPMIQQQKINGSVVKGDHRHPMIATVDIARSAAEHLHQRDFAGHTVETLLGPEDISMNEATRALGAALGIADLAYVEFPPEGMLAALQGIGMSAEFASLLVESQIAINEDRVMNGLRRTAENMTPTRLDQFLQSALSR